MKPVNRMIYDEMNKLGLLKKKKEQIKVVDENGKLVLNKWGNPITKTITAKNFQTASKNKNSNGKSYFVEEPVYEKYLEIKEKEKSDNEKHLNKS